MSSSALLPLLVFMALLLAAALHILAASGHFPAEHRAPALRNPLGRAILFGTSTIVLLALPLSLVTIWTLAPWYAAVIAGGFAILIAPLVLQPFPDRFVNGRASLVVFSAMTIGLAAVLFALA
jgi:hypothetical protein